MRPMRVNLHPRHWLLILLGTLFAIYCLFQARFLVFGPGITVFYPLDGAVATSSVIRITGQARNAARLTLNGSPIFTDERGYWEEKLILSPGTSIMTVLVRDRFGREAESHVRITFNN